MEAVKCMTDQQKTNLLGFQLHMIVRLRNVRVRSLHQVGGTIIHPPGRRPPAKLLAMQPNFASFRAGKIWLHSAFLTFADELLQRPGRYDAQPSASQPSAG